MNVYFNKDIEADDKSKASKFNSEQNECAINLQHIYKNSDNRSKLNLFHLKFTKLKRIMSNIDNNIKFNKKRLYPSKRNTKKNGTAAHYKWSHPATLLIIN